MPAENPRVDEFLSKEKSWKAEMIALRSILLTFDLVEEFKWYKPVYVFQGSNLFAIAGLKDHCWLMFFKGALLKDPHNILAAPGENSQSQRILKLKSVEDIVRLQDTIKAYVAESMNAERAGLKVDFSKSTNLVYPDELTQKFEQSPDLKQAFLALTPGRQRAYNMHFTQPKQSATRMSRIEKYAAQILAGKGMND